MISLNSYYTQKKNIDHWNYIISALGLYILDKGIRQIRWTCSGTSYSFKYYIWLLSLARGLLSIIMEYVDINMGKLFKGAIHLRGWKLYSSSDVCFHTRLITEPIHFKRLQQVLNWKTIKPILPDVTRQKRVFL